MSEQIDHDSSRISCQLLSISSQENASPPKHSTPKRNSSKDEDRPPMEFDQSTIYTSSSVASASSVFSQTFFMDVLKRAPKEGRKEELVRFLTSEANKKKQEKYSRGAISSAAFTSSNNNKPNVVQNFQQSNPKIMQMPQMSSSTFVQSQKENIKPSSSTELMSTPTKSGFKKRSALDDSEQHQLPKFEPPSQPSSRPISSASMDTLSSKARKNVLGIHKNKDKISFGYVSLGESFVIKQSIYNRGMDQLRIKCHIESVTGSDKFTIVEVSAPIMDPGEECQITIRFEPTSCDKCTANLVIERINGGFLKFTFNLVGYGGKANVALSQCNFNDGLVQRSSSGILLLSPNSFTRYYLSFENTGERAAFVHLTPFSRYGKKLPEEFIKFEPGRFVLDGSGGRGTRCAQKVLVRLNDAFMYANDEDAEEKTDGRNSVPTGRNVRRESGTSSFLSRASNTSRAPECAYQILVFSGEEAQRQKLKSWERLWNSGDYFLHHGVRFTEEYQNEGGAVDGRNAPHEYARQPLGLLDYDQEFKNTLRITTLNVLDNRPEKYFGRFPTPRALMAHQHFFDKDQSIAIQPTKSGESSSVSFAS